jgi:hypothetical protein
MTLEELSDHTANVRACLDAKRHQLADLDPATAAVVTSQIKALTPRVAELEAACDALRRLPVVAA